MGNDLNMSVTTGINSAKTAMGFTTKDFAASWTGSATMDNCVDVGGKKIWVDDAALDFLKQQGLVEQGGNFKATSDAYKAHASADGMIVVKEAGMLGDQVAKVGGF